MSEKALKIVPALDAKTAPDGSPGAAAAMPDGCRGSAACGASASA